MGDRLKALDQRLRTVVRKHWTYRLEVLGRVGDRPFYRLTIPPRGRLHYALCLASGVHGDEPAGVEALLRLIDEQAIPSGVAIDCFPCMNPLGFEAGRREDDGGDDLNRRFGTERPPAPVRLFQEAVSGRRYDLFLDLHEDSGTCGFYAFELAAGGAVLGRSLVRELAGRAIRLEPAEAITRVLTEDGLMPSKGEIADGLARVDPDGVPTCFAQAVYMMGDHADLAMTFETPSALPFEERVRMHMEAVRFVLEQLRGRGLFWDAGHHFTASEPGFKR